MGESVGRVACTLLIAATVAAQAPRAVNVAPARFTKLAGPRPGGRPMSTYRVCSGLPAAGHQLFSDRNLGGDEHGPTDQDASSVGAALLRGRMVERAGDLDPLATRR